MLAFTGPDRGNREAIECAAYGLFRKVGYKKTSYTKIAEESGFGRPLVQYYFPKKDDIATGFVLRALDSIAALVDSSDELSKLPQGQVVQLGQVYYSFLLSDEAMRQLTLDLLSSRQLTSKVIEANANYTVPLLCSSSDKAKLVEASVKATGGVYELIYRGLEAGLALDPDDLAVQNTAAFITFSTEMGYKDAVCLLQPELFSPKTIEGFIPELALAVFGDKG